MYRSNRENNNRKVSQIKNATSKLSNYKMGNNQSNGGAGGIGPYSRNGHVTSNTF